MCVQRGQGMYVLALTWCRGVGTIYNSGLSIERNKWSGAVTGPDGSPERPENVCSGVDSWCRGVGTTPALSIERNKWCCYGEDGGVTVR